MFLCLNEEVGQIYTVGEFCYIHRKKGKWKLKELTLITRHSSKNHRYIGIDFGVKRS